MTVYFIQSGGPEGPIKIGYTAGNPHSRLADLQTGNPCPLRLLVSTPGSLADERALHQRFAALRISGEWFRADAALLGFVEGLRWAFPEQPKPEPVDTGRLYGLTREQVDAICGAVAGRLRHSRALELVVALDPCFGRAECDLLNEAHGLLHWVTDQLEAHEDPFAEGVRFSVDIWQALAALDRACLAQRALDAEEQLAVDAHALEVPVELDAEALGPLADEPQHSRSVH